MVLVVPIVILVLMWIVVILPQQRRVRAHRRFVAGLEVGDEVITTSGLYGEVLALEEETARLRLAPDAVITIARLAIARPQHEPAPPDPEPAPEPPHSSGTVDDAAEADTTDE